MRLSGQPLLHISVAEGLVIKAVLVVGVLSTNRRIGRLIVPKGRPYLSGTYTQTRTFVYSGQDLVSETNPETGTTTYAYNADHQVTTRTWSNKQETRYVYDAYGRLTQVEHWETVCGGFGCGPFMTERTQ